MEGKLNWRELFQGKLLDNGFRIDDVHTIYRIEMDARAFFDFGDIMPEWMQLQNIERDGVEIRFTWASRSTTAECPNCHHESTSKRGDHDHKTVQDIPREGMAVYHDAVVSKYNCNNSRCSTKIFVERIPTLVGEKGRKTHRFKNYCISRASASGCFRAQTDIRREGGVVSNDTIGRYIKAESTEVVKANLESDNVRVLSLDDFNLRKGDSSTGCTVFVDGDTRRVLILVKGTTKDAAINVMKRFQSAEILSRDRATSYSSAGKEMGLTQVADRFHLIDNAQRVAGSDIHTERRWLDTLRPRWCQRTRRYAVQRIGRGHRGKDTACGSHASQGKEVQGHVANA
jgi:transposase